MESEKILSNITERLGNTSLSERTIQKYIELNPIAEGAEPDESYFTNATDFLSALSGQYNHDVAEKVKEIKAQYKEPNGLSNNVKIDNANDDTIKALQDKYDKMFQELSDKLTDSENKRAQSDLREKVVKGMRSKNATDEYVLKNTLKGVVFDDSKSVDELVDQYLKVYDKELTEARGNGARPRTAGGGKGLSAADAYFKAKAKREGWNK